MKGPEGKGKLNHPPRPELMKGACRASSPGRHTSVRLLQERCRSEPESDSLLDGVKVSDEVMGRVQFV